MTAEPNRSRAVLALVAACVAVAGWRAPGVRAASLQVGEVLARRIGWQVNRVQVEATSALRARGGKPSGRRLSAENTCAVASAGECRAARASAQPGAFARPRGVAVQTDPTRPDFGDVYVADSGNDRVQELTPGGRFVRMFGWDVNLTKDAQAAATQAERNVCTEREVELGARCGVGVPGTAAGQFEFPCSVTVDPASGDVYVQEIAADDYRVDRYTADGRFLWTAGGGVNATADRNGGGEAERNLCVAASGAACRGGAPSAPWSSQRAAFYFIQSRGNLLAVGPEGVLYVGDYGRIQELGADGAWLRELPLRSLSTDPSSWVTALAADGAGGVYLVYPREAQVVRRLNATGAQVAQMPVSAGRPTAQVAEIGTLALTPAGGLAVSVEQASQQSPSRWVGSLYDPETGYPLSSFPGWGRSGMAFAPDGEMYAAALPNAYAGFGDELLVYRPAAELQLVSSLVDCETAARSRYLAAFECPGG